MATQREKAHSLSRRRAQRELRLEALESRTVLSAMPPIGPMFHLETPRDWSPTMPAPPAAVKSVVSLESFLRDRGAPPMADLGRMVSLETLAAPRGLLGVESRAFSFGPALAMGPFFDLSARVKPVVSVEVHESFVVRESVGVRQDTLLDLTLPLGDDRPLLADRPAVSRSSVQSWNPPETLRGNFVVIAISNVNVRLGETALAPPAAFYRAPDPLAAAAEESAAVHASAEPGVRHSITPVASIRLPASADEAGKPAASSAVAQPASPDAGSWQAGPTVSSPAYESTRSAATSVNPASPAWTSPADSGEGGFVELDSGPRVLSGPSGLASAGRAASPKQLGAADSRDGLRLLPAADATADDDHSAESEASAVTTPSRRVAQESLLAASSEGGMIELAAVPPAAESCGAAGNFSALADRRAPAGEKDLGIQGALGLFQAFELAPTAADETAAAAAETTGAPTGSDSPLAAGANRPGKGTYVLPIQRAGVPAVLVASLLVAIDKIHRDAAAEAANRRTPPRFRGFSELTD